MTQQRQLQLVLYQALAQPIGLLVQASPDPAQVQQRLYVAKFQANDVALADLLIKHAPPGIAPPSAEPGEGYLVIYKKSALEAAQTKPSAASHIPKVGASRPGLFDGMDLSSLLSPEDEAQLFPAPEAPKSEP